jgi:uncharacterized protein
MSHSEPLRRIAGHGHTLAIGTQVVLAEDRPIVIEFSSALADITTTIDATASTDASKTPGYKKAGTVGMIVAAPLNHSEGYRIECFDGKTVFANDSQIQLRRAEVDSLLNLVVTEDELRKHIFYQCMVGSRAYGLSNENSDEDIRGIYFAPPELDWSLYAVPEQIEGNDEGQDAVFFELKKYLKLALKANPNILELLWTPLVLQSDPLADQLRGIRQIFLSQHIHRTYSGYVFGQFRRMKNAIQSGGQFKPKHAMHLIRLLHSGTHALNAGEIMVDVSVHRDELLEIRSGRIPFDAIHRRALELVDRFDQAARRSSLPDQPNINAANEFLIEAKRSRLQLP